MKIAKIIPLFKAGDKKEFAKYRPVSILPQFSKKNVTIILQEIVSISEI